MSDKIQIYKSKYYSIRSIYCLALKETVCFNNYGFNHLIRKNRKYRTKTDRKRRFLLLNRVGIILGRGAVKDYVKKGKKKFWSIEYKNNFVILRKINNKELHFYSIFDKK